MTRRNHDLLTTDEARDLVGRGAIALADALGDQTSRLEALLAGGGTIRGLPLETRAAVHVWRETLARVRSLGLDWILEEQIEGALSYAGLDWYRRQCRAA